MNRTIAAVAAVVVLAVSPVARADTLEELVPRLIDQSGLLRPHYPGEPASHPAPAAAQRDVSVAPSPPSVLGNRLHVTLLARDWREAYTITEGSPLLLDRVRLIRSSRMAVTRVSWAGGAILPYAEVALGQWRADTDLVPWLKPDEVAAAQLVAGVEMHVAQRFAVACDVEQTRVYPAGRQDVPATSVLASFAALRAEF